MNPAYRIPPLHSGGLMLSYHCDSACRHCLYRCSPRQPDTWLTLETAERIFRALQAEPELSGIHLAGGEPTLNMELLVEVIRLAARMRIPIDYIETNATGCEDLTEALARMRRLKEAGLNSVMISASMFHNEFIPFSTTRNAVEAANAVFGQYNVMVYMSHVYDRLQSLGPGTHTLPEFMRAAGIEGHFEELPKVYDIIPGGRAASALSRCFPAQPAESFRSVNCRASLESTHHFHIDHEGHLFTGLCAGIVPATPDNFHPDITPDSHPVFTMLCDGGPCRLMDVAVATAGFSPRPTGYVSKCDLCMDVRGTLVKSEKYLPELKPANYYNCGT